jgi:hypothetical protein
VNSVLRFCCRRLIWSSRCYREEGATIAASGASVAPRFGPVIETRYFVPRWSSGTVIENAPSLAVRLAPNLSHPVTPQAKQSAKAECRIRVPEFVGE